MSHLSRPLTPTSTSLLRQLIDDPALAATIRSLAPESLASLIQHVGLEDAGEIVGLATAEQLLSVFDADLWRRERGGEDDAFSPERFLLWLEVLLEGGEKVLVSRLADLPEDLLFSAFYDHILVLNLDDLAEAETAWRSENIDFADKALMDCLGQELDEYHIIARRENGWDTVLKAIMALYEHEPDLLNRILARCCHASWEHIEDNGGLYEVLTSEEMLACDAAADRADRRAARGYVAPSDATALFKLALAGAPRDLVSASEPDPITRAYFRELSTAGGKQGEATRRDDGANRTRASSRLTTILRRLDLLEETPPMALLAETGRPSGDEGRFLRAMKILAEADPGGHEQRVQQLVYLANVIEAGLGSSEAPIRPVDAMGMVFDVLDAALAHFDTHPPKEGPLSIDRLCTVPPVALFLAGWSKLSEKRALDTPAALRSAVQDALLR